MQVRNPGLLRDRVEKQLEEAQALPVLFFSSSLLSSLELSDAKSLGALNTSSPRNRCRAKRGQLQRILGTFVFKMAQVKARIWLWLAYLFRKGEGPRREAARGSPGPPGTATERSHPGDNPGANRWFL